RGTRARHPSGGARPCPGAPLLDADRSAWYACCRRDQPEHERGVMADPHSADATRHERSRSFGTVASHYEQFRPGPPTQVVEWFLPAHVGRVVDLGAGT